MSVIRLSARDVALSAMGIVLTCLATIGFQVYIPATRGYFNVGETMVYTIALLFGPYVGAIAGGIGSMLADILTYYYQYAPATLLIKGVEGFVVGALAARVKKIPPKKAMRYLSAVTSIIVALIIGILGVTFYTGESLELSLATVSLELAGFDHFLLTIVWGFVGLTTAIASMIIGLKVEPRAGLLMLVIIMGGLEMVLGYFLYEAYLYGVAAALVELPFNIMQMLVGLCVSLPLFSMLERRLKLTRM